MKVKGFILKSKNLGENLRQIVVFSDKLGMLNLIVKTNKIPFPLSVDLFSLSQFELVQIGERFEVKQVKLIEHNFPKSFRHFVYMSKIAKLLSQFPLAKNEKLFQMVERYLKITEKFNLAYTMFLVKFAFVEGIFPVLNRCAVCKKAIGKDEEVGGFSIKHSGIVCFNCKDNHALKWNLKDSKLTIKLAKEPFHKAKTQKLANAQLGRIRSTFEKYVVERLQ